MTVMMKNYIYTILLLIMPLMATAQDVPVNEYSKALGDSAYSQERYSDAVRIYETVITNEGGSSDLYYNLGNAFFRYRNRMHFGCSNRNLSCKRKYSK